MTNYFLAFIFYALTHTQVSANEPATQPTNLTFSNQKTFRLTVAFTHAQPQCDGYIVLRSINNPVIDVPVDGMVYAQGDYIGSAKVAYIGNGNSFNANKIIADQHYYFSVFAYNGSGNTIDYLAVNPLTGDYQTAKNEIGNYYSNIRVTDSLLVDKLKTLTQPHSQIAYNQFINTNINNFASVDTSAGQKYVTCVYSGQQYVYSGTFTWIGSGPGIFSREHTFPQSWMETIIGQSVDGRPEHSDQHALFPVNQNQVNGVRSNYPFNDVVTVQSSFLEGKLGRDAANNIVYEPKAGFKGDVSRALMYMCIAYDNKPVGKRWFLPVIQNQNALKKWHFQDLPDNWEVTRNDYVQSIQFNRNPFVDSTDLACFINFRTLIRELDTNWLPCKKYIVKKVDSIIDTSTVAIIPIAQYLPEMLIYPNPLIDNYLQVNFENIGMENHVLEIYDAIGKLEDVIYEIKEGVYRIPFQKKSGIYYLKLNAGKRILYQKVFKL